MGLGVSCFSRMHARFGIKISEMNHIAKVISASIKEGRWLYVTYNSSRSPGDTFFWFCIKDIDPQSKKLTGEMFNKKYGFDSRETTIYFDSIKDAVMLSFTTYDVPPILIDKIEKNPLAFSFLEYKSFDNNILDYLVEANNLDADPYEVDYAMIAGIDAEVLKDKKEHKLNDEQIEAVTNLIYRSEVRDRDKNRNIVFALSVLAVEAGNKKFVVAYYEVRYDPSKKTLKLTGEIKFNKSFLVDGPTHQTHSIHRYCDLEVAEFAELYNRDPIEAAELLRPAAKEYGEVVSTRPDFLFLARNTPVSIARAVSIIEEREENGTLNVPLKAFFGDISLKNRGHKTPDIVIYDKRVNIDQMLVLFNSMKDKVTYVQGPPGTGKTQTLFNVLISAYFNNKSVLVSSMNNKPVDGIIEKLSFVYKKKPIPFPYLRLGNTEKVAKATLAIREYAHTEWKGEPVKRLIDQIKDQQIERNAKLVSLLAEYEKRKEADEFLSAAKATRIKLGENAHNLDEEIKKLKEKRDSLREVQNDEVISLFEPASSSNRYLSYLYFSSIQKLNLLKEPRFSPLVSICDIDDEDTRVEEFNKWLSIDENLKLLMKVFPIIFTTNSSASRLGSGKVMFDLAIMDEAGQCDIAKSLLVLVRAESLLLVGDKDQLQPVIVMDPNVNDYLMSKYHISSRYDYCRKSIIVTMQEADNISKKILLSYHYRCGRKIVSFSNQYFYDRCLKLDYANGEGKIELKQVKNTKTPVRNQCLEEADAIVQYIKRNQKKGIIIITPFVNQQMLINRLLKREGISLEDAKACTIHSVQGAEASEIILSPAVSHHTSKATYQWMTQHREIVNVAVTRAQKRLVIFADAKAIKAQKTGDDVWNELIRYADKNGEIEVIPPSLEIKNIGRSNGSANEDEFYKTMAQMFSVHKNFSLRRNVPLSKLFPDDPDFKASQQELDAVIYTKSVFSREYPTMAFEIDGPEHVGDAIREARDRRKEELCKSHNIKLYRISNEFVKDYEFLRELLRKTNKQEFEQLSLFEF